MHLNQPKDFLSVRGALAKIRSDFLHQGHSDVQFLKIEMVLAEALNNIAEHGGPMFTKAQLPSNGSMNRVFSAQH